MIAETRMRIVPPLPRRERPFRMWMISPKSFGASRIAMVIPNSASARSASKLGQAGKSENSSVKYSGRMKRACRASTMPQSSMNIHKGEAR